MWYGHEPTYGVLKDCAGEVAPQSRSQHPQPHILEALLYLKHNRHGKGLPKQLVTHLDTVRPVVSVFRRHLDRGLLHGGHISEKESEDP